MLNLSQALFSAESIQHQHNRSLFDAVTQAFVYIRDTFGAVTDARQALDASEASGLTQLMKERTGLTLHLGFVGNAHLSGMLIIPTFDKNHPFVQNGYARKARRPKVFEAFSKDLSNDLIGKIDLEKGTVSGIYSKVPLFIALSEDIYASTSVTPEEAAAIFLHEVGHAMTYFEYLGRTTFVAHVLGDAFLEFFDKEIPRRRDKFLRGLQTDMGLENLEDYGKYVDEGNGEAVRLLFLTSYVQKPVSGLNAPYFDMTTMEALADQYVARLGGARAMATGLDKVYRHAGDVVYKARHKHILVEAIRAVGMVAILPLTALLLAYVEPTQVHDVITDRIHRLRRDLIAGSKHPTLDKDTRRRIDDDIKVIDEVLSKINDNVTLFTRIWELTNSKARASKRESGRLMEIESLVNNELYRVHNTLKVLES